MKYVRYRTADGGSYTGILSRDEKIISLGQLNPEWMGLDMISIMLLLQDDPVLLIRCSFCPPSRDRFMT